MIGKNQATVRIALVLMPLLLLAVSPFAPARAEEPDDVPAGQAAFVANKCNLCHSVEAVGIEARTKSEKMRGPDQSEVGKRHDVEWVKQFLDREVMLDEKQHKKEYKGTPEDLVLIAEWLVGLTPASK